MYIGNMYLDDGGLYRSDGIPDGNGGMGVPGRVQDNAVVIKTGPMNLVDQLPFHIALKVGETHRWVFSGKGFQVLFKGLVTIDLRFPLSEQVKIGAIDDGYPHRSRCFQRIYLIPACRGCFHQVDEFIKEIP